MIFAALSCLQGRLLREAVDDLLKLDIDGIQLTPGNVPKPGDREAVKCTTRTHHGFSWTSMKKEVWEGKRLCVESDSIHPMLAGDFEDLPHSPVYEVMYPGYVLGNGKQVKRAMELGFKLAVDISHVFIQLQEGAMTQATWQQLSEYDKIVEIHVSQNNGKQDTHRPLTEQTWGLEWARARERAGTLLVVEGYMHRLSVCDRKRQIDIARGK